MSSEEIRAGWAGSTMTPTRRVVCDTKAAPWSTIQMPERDRTRETATSPGSPGRAAVRRARPATATIEVGSLPASQFPSGRSASHWSTPAVVDSTCQSPVRITKPGPFGKVPSQVPLEDAQASARAAAMAMLPSLKRAIGELNKAAAWLVIHASINADPCYAQTTLVANPASELLIDLCGSEAGAHARTAIGAAALPVGLPVILAAEAELAA